MLFNSISFLIFFPVVFFLYFALPGRARPWLILAASCYFYMAFVPKYILILFFLIVVDYTLGIAIERFPERKKPFFVLSIMSNLGMLFLFKYFDFFRANVEALASLLNWNYSLGALQLALPLGLSFHIFQSLSYIIEVYKGRYKAERNFSTYALYVMFFPQLVAGPIERPQHLLPQLKAVHAFDYARVVSGMKLMLWGFFKKIVIANPLARSVDFVYANLDSADGSIVLVAALAFSFVLYADFSGYSDIAIGAARVLGIDLSPNFLRPYFSKSIPELWRRWHISLSSWFRDYVYFPLAWKGNKRGAWWIYVSVFITFALTGVWHGAGWNYLLMGVLFGVYITLSLSTKRWRESLRKALGLGGPVLAAIQIAITFALTSMAWVFFRAPDAAHAVEVFKRLFTSWDGDAFRFVYCTDCSAYTLGISRTELGLVTLSIMLLIACEYVEEHKISLPAFATRRSVRWPAYYVFLLWILFVGDFAPKTFIYFQF